MATTESISDVIHLLVENVQLSERIQDMERQLDEMKENVETAKAQAKKTQLELEHYQSQESFKLEAWRFVLAAGLYSLALWFNRGRKTGLGNPFNFIVD